MNNVVLHKPASATRYIKPFSPSRAVDGSGYPTKRWLANVPCAMSVDLLETAWVDRWVVHHMGAVGWYDGNYNNNSFRIAGSLDGINWVNFDSVTGNTSASIDRHFVAQQVRFIRLEVTRGMNINPQLASIAELAVFEASPTSSFLSSLEISSGTLSPSFSSTEFTYTAEVAYDTSEIIVVPTSMDEGMITVDGVSVPSGSPSNPIQLQMGQNLITVEVTAKVGGGKNTYQLVVTRVPNLYLTSLQLAYSGRRYSETDFVDMNHTDLSYTDHTSIKATSVEITPTAEDASVTILIDGQRVASGSQSTSIALPDASHTFSIIVSNSLDSSTRTYSLTIERS